MAQNLKPVIDELKAKFANREELRDAVLENIKQTRETVEKTLKVVAEQAKESGLVHDYVIPAMESEKADQAMKFLNDKLGTSPLVTKIEQARKAIIDLKVEKAKPAPETTPAQAASSSADTATEEKPAKKRASKITEQE
jgi:hypothetical protein